MNKKWATKIEDASTEVDVKLLQWWLSDYLACPLTHLPLSACPDRSSEQAFDQAAARLAKGEPVQYVCGRAPFRELELKVDKRVLIPRPETEQFVQIALDRLLQAGDRVLDIGTGSGCIALAIKYARPDCRVEGWDLSEDALELARENAQKLKLDVQFRQADLLTPGPFQNSLAVTGRQLPGQSRRETTRAAAQVELLIANLPYIGEKEADDLPKMVREFEPHMALFSGPDGTDLILKLLEQAKEVLAPGGHLLLETGENQGPIWKKAAKTLNWSLEGKKDLAGRERFWILKAL